MGMASTLFSNSCDYLELPTYKLYNTRTAFIRKVKIKFQNSSMQNLTLSEIICCRWEQNTNLSRTSSACDSI